MKFLSMLSMHLIALLVGSLLINDIDFSICVRESRHLILVTDLCMKNHMFLGYDDNVFIFQWLHIDIG